MRQFEYTIRIYDDFYNYPIAALDMLLNEMGREGWNVYHLHECHIDNKPKMLIFAKKEKHSDNVRLLKNTS